MECEEPVTRRPTGQIVMDYLTDTVLSHKVTLLGQPYITPDSRIVVTVHREKTSVTLIVQHTTGIVFLSYALSLCALISTGNREMPHSGEKLQRGNFVFWFSL